MRQQAKASVQAAQALEARHQPGVLEALEEALALDPDYTPALLMLGRHYAQKCDFPAARKALDHLHALAPGSWQDLAGQAYLAYREEKYAEATQVFLAAWQLKPDDTDLLAATGICLQHQGNLLRGWEFVAARAATLGPRPDLPFWKGEPLAGKTLYIWQEQGIGDHVIYYQMLPELEALGARLVVEADPRLAGLLARSFPAVTFVTLDPATRAQTARKHKADLQCYASWPGRYLRHAPEHFKNRGAFLKPDPVKVAAWKEKLAALGDGPKVGICWRSSLHSAFRNMFYTSPWAEWQPLLKVPGVHFTNAQYEATTEELDQLRHESSVTLFDPGIDQKNDLEETFAYLAALDLVITTPVSVAMFAASTGTAVWEMWHGAPGVMEQGWWPAKRMYHRATHQTWDGVFQRMSDDLTAWVRLQTPVTPPASRNAPCPCGSGLRYKHCHGLSMEVTQEPFCFDPINVFTGRQRVLRSDHPAYDLALFAGQPQPDLELIIPRNSPVEEHSLLSYLQDHVSLHKEDPVLIPTYEPEASLPRPVARLRLSESHIQRGQNWLATQDLTGTNAFVVQASSEDLPPETRRTFEEKDLTIIHLNDHTLSEWLEIFLIAEAETVLGPNPGQGAIATLFGKPCTAGA